MEKTTKGDAGQVVLMPLKICSRAAGLQAEIEWMPDTSRPKFMQITHPWRVILRDLDAGGVIFQVLYKRDRDQAVIAGMEFVFAMSEAEMRGQPGSGWMEVAK